MCLPVRSSPECRRDPFLVLLHRRGSDSLSSDRAAGHQERIDQHFSASSRYWLSLYEEDSLYGVIHQLRRMLALRWLDECGLPHGSRVVDVGCGAGVLALDMAHRGHLVDGLDSSHAMIEQAANLVTEAGVAGRVRLRVGDAHDLPFPDHSFDCAIGLGVLPYTHTPGRALSEMARVVRPAGYVIVNSDNLLRLNHLLDPLHTPLLAPARRAARAALSRVGRLPESLPSGLLSSRSLRRLLDEAGLQVVRYRTIGFGPFSFVGWQPLPDPIGQTLHRHLQRAADRGVPILRATGDQELVLATRGGHQREQS